MSEPRKVVTHTPAGNPIRHGIVSSYDVYGCRCLECTEANRYYRRVVQQGKRLAQTRAGAIPETVGHGKESTYVNWGCRCAPCLEAGKAKNASYYVRVLSRDARNIRARGAYTIGYVDGVLGVEEDPSQVEA